MWQLSQTFANELGRFPLLSRRRKQGCLIFYECECFKQFGMVKLLIRVCVNNVVHHNTTFAVKRELSRSFSLLPLALKSIMTHTTGLTGFVNPHGWRDYGTFTSTHNINICISYICEDMLTRRS